MKIGQIGNLIIWGTVPRCCPVCGKLIPAGEVHRHDGPLDLHADDEGGRRMDLWIEVSE